MSVFIYSGRVVLRQSNYLFALVGDVSVTQCRTNAWRASLGKVSRTQYLHRFPVRLVRPDGSSIDIRTSEPRQVVQLAIDLKSLSEDDRRQRLAARKPKAKKIKQEVIDDNFDANDYMKFFSENKNASEEDKKTENR